MPSSINVVALSGNLTRDPDLRHTSSGKAVAELRLAVNERFKAADGDWKDRAHYISVTVWGKQGEWCAERLSKGSQVTVQGRLQWREWEDKQTGAKREKVDVVADAIVFPRGEPGSGGGGGGGGGSVADDFVPTGVDADSDIPF